MTIRKILFLLIIFFGSCTNSSYIPTGIIKPGQMQDIVWDIIRGDILAQELIKGDSVKTYKNESFAISEQIFSIHGITREKFEKSAAFYEKHPDLIKVVFDSLHALKTRKNFFEAKAKIKPGKKPLTPPHTLKVK